MCAACGSSARMGQAGGLVSLPEAPEFILVGCDHARRLSRVCDFLGVDQHHPPDELLVDELAIDGAWILPEDV